jgi:membrane-bound lytic murein transglycosylase A
MAACSRDEAPVLPPPPIGAAEVVLEPVAFDALPGWDSDRVTEALPALRRSCAVFSRMPAGQWVGVDGRIGTYGEWQALCGELNRALPPANSHDEAALRTWLEARLRPFAVVAEDGTQRTGTFTGYYEAALDGARTQGAGYQTPLYALPDDLVTVDLGDTDPALKGQRVVGRVDGTRLRPYWTRREIEEGALKGRAKVLFWAADPVDAHILHIQGSGQIRLPDGTRQRIGYAGNNGHGFVGIGGEMLRRGVVAPGQASMPAIRSWLKAHPDQARDIMQANARYIFFREIEGDGPIGAFGVPLTAGRSVAVDTRYVPLGIPLWLDSVDPDGLPLDRLVVAQDIGSAIKGVVRGDFFWGSGEAALAKAGRMKSAGRWYLLLPRDPAALAAAQ